MKEIVDLIKEKDVIVFCGAGLSSESGIPTFRGREGLWEKYDPQIYVTTGGISSLFVYETHKLKNFIIDFYTTILKAKPNYSHFALKKLEDRGYLIGIITQNIDDFHHQVGSKEVAEVHGNAYKFRCKSCQIEEKKVKQEVKGFIEELKREDNLKKIRKKILKFLGRCPKCKRRKEVGVVLFGDPLPEKELEKTYYYLNKAKTILCVGTSGLVYPAASFPLYAKERGAKIINVNISESNLDNFCDFLVREKSSNFFKKLLSNL